MFQFSIKEMCLLLLVVLKFCHYLSSSVWKKTTSKHEMEYMLFTCVLKVFFGNKSDVLKKTKLYKELKIVIHFEKSYFGSLVLPLEKLALRGYPTYKVLGLVAKTKFRLKIMKFITNFEKKSVLGFWGF